MEQYTYVLRILAKVLACLVRNQLFRLWNSREHLFLADYSPSSLVSRSIYIDQLLFQANIPSNGWHIARIFQIW